MFGFPGKYNPALTPRPRNGNPQGLLLTFRFSLANVCQAVRRAVVTVSNCLELLSGGGADSFKNRGIIHWNREASFHPRFAHRRALSYANGPFATHGLALFSRAVADTLSPDKLEWSRFCSMFIRVRDPRFVSARSPQFCSARPEPPAGKEQ